MVFQDPNNSNVFYLHSAGIDQDLWHLIVEWARTARPLHDAARMHRVFSTRDGHVQTTDTRLEFKLPRDAMEFKLRFSVV